MNTSKVYWALIVAIAVPIITTSNNCLRLMHIVCSIQSPQASSLSRLSIGLMLMHRHYYSATFSYLLDSYLGFLVIKASIVADLADAALEKDILNCCRGTTRYELFTEFTPSLLDRIEVFRKTVLKREASPISADKAKRHWGYLKRSTHMPLPTSNRLWQRKR